MIRFRRTSARLLALLSLALGLGSLAPPLEAQSLTDHLRPKSAALEKSPDSLELRLGRDRVDLGLGPNLRPTLGPDRKTVDLSAQADLRMICGHYDLKASLQHLLGREAREEFLEGVLGTLVQQAAGSGMELLCQAEPTLCTLLQNYSVSAHLKMGYYKDLCQAVERGALDARQKSYASGVDACLKEKKDQGYSIDRAMDLCQKKTPELHGFRGDVVGELDLGKELESLSGQMGLSPGARKLAAAVGDQTTLGPVQVAARLDPSLLPRIFDERQAELAGRLGDLVARAAKHESPQVAELQALVPPGAPGLAQDELQDLARLTAREQASVVASLSSAWAFFQMGEELRELERALEVLKSAPTLEEEKRKLLEDRLALLKSEKTRLAERFRDQELVMQALGAAKSLGAQEYQKRVAQVEARAGEAGRKRDLANDSRSYGTLPSTELGPVGGRSASQAPLGVSAACSSCGGEWSLGTLGEPK